MPGINEPDLEEEHAQDGNKERRRVHLLQRAALPVHAAHLRQPEDEQEHADIRVADAVQDIHDDAAELEEDEEHEEPRDILKHAGQD